MRWYVLLVMTAVSGCYAVPSKHDIEPVDQAETGIEPGSDADLESKDAGGGSDAGSDEPDSDVVEMDAGTDSGPSSSDGSSVSEDGGADAETSVCGSCSDADAPQCKVETKQCVACLADDAGACHGQLCSSLNTCIECRTNKDCTNPAASLCEMGTGKCIPCADGNDGQCTHITGKNVCAAGQCVQCTKDKRSVCKSAGGAATACDNATHACTQYELGKTEICGLCVSDAQCRMGSRCVQTLYQGTSTDVVGWHCQWEPGSAGGPAYCDSAIRPFIGMRKIGSIDAPSLQRDTCVLNATSCPAYAAFGTNCGRYTRGNVSVIVENAGDPKIPAADRGAAALPYITPDDTACPGPGSKCAVKDQGTGAFRCTTRCGNNANDCVDPFACLTGPPSYCSVNVN